jgi:aldehyde:ferredoxin oxidoreductase
MANGYMGKILWVDLSERKISVEALEEKTCRKFLGGYGLGAHVLFNRMQKRVDPLGPDNILGILTGPFTGNPVPGGSRYTVVGKSPLTGGWGDANSGGFFGPHLKFAGYDGIFFSGRSEKPVYLNIHDGEFELRDATHLWGQTTAATEQMIQAERGRETRVASIGPAGEKMALIAAIINEKGRAAGRSGLGAVMGSKNLKAVAVNGRQKIATFNESGLMDLRKKTLAQLSSLVELMRGFGTCAMLVHAVQSDDAPVKNWAGSGPIDFPEAELIGGNRVIERQERKYACFQCPLGCGGLMKPGTGEYRYEDGAHKPEYETLGMFGSNCLNSNLDSIIKLNDLCNVYGLDTISAGAVTAFAIECYENGLITRHDTDGLELTWGNHRAMVQLVEKMGKREGFGSVLADGVQAAAIRIGHGSDRFAIHLHGQEYPAHDPHQRLKWTLAYRMDATPARHTQGGGMAPPGLIMPPVDPVTHSGAGLGQKTIASFNHVINSSGMCQIVMGTFPSVGTVVDFMNAVTGWGVTLEELLETGERIANIRHAFNLREGLNPLDYQIPSRVSARPPAREGSLAGVNVKEGPIDAEFCRAMDWDVATAKPSRQKLLQLGLDEVAQEFWPE